MVVTKSTEPIISIYRPQYMGAVTTLLQDVVITTSRFSRIHGTLILQKSMATMFKLFVVLFHHAAIII